MACERHGTRTLDLKSNVSVIIGLSSSSEPATHMPLRSTRQPGSEHLACGMPTARERVQPRTGLWRTASGGRGCGMCAAGAS